MAAGKNAVIVVPTMNISGSYTERFAPGREPDFCFGGNICHTRVAESHDTVELFLGLY